MHNKHRVFYHELGHLVADELNHQYGKGPAVIQIQINATGIDDFEGAVKLATTANGGPTREELPYYLAALDYGCIFESIYLKKDSLHDCNRTNGHDDMSLRNSLLEKYGLFDHRAEFTAIADTHYRIVKVDVVIGKLVEVDPAPYFEKTTTGEQVKLGDLMQLIAGDIKAFGPSYMLLTDDYRRLIDSLNALPGI